MNWCWLYVLLTRLRIRSIPMNLLLPHHLPLELLSHSSLLLLICMILVIIVGIEAVLITFDAYLLQEKYLIVLICSVREEDGNCIVDAHDCKQEHKEGT